MQIIRKQSNVREEYLKARRMKNFIMNRISKILINIESETHLQMGISLLAQGELNEAIDSFNKAIELNPDNPKSHLNIGNTFKKQNNLNAAIDSYKVALELKPNFPEACNALGIAYQNQGNLEAAIESLNRAILLKPNFPETYYHLGNTYIDQGDLMSAITSLNKAIQLEPGFAEAHNNLGNVLREQGKLDAAISSFNTALLHAPDWAEAYNNLGYALHKKGDPIEAINMYKTAVKLKPSLFGAHYNLANALKKQGHISQAADSYKIALEHRPDFSDAHWNLAIATLLLGDYKGGWEKYEWRLRRGEKSSNAHASPNCALWNGEPITDKTKLLLITEQGLGDTLQFMRYVLALKQQGINISLCAQPKLHSLIQASGIDATPLTPDQANQVNEGQWMPLLSLPKYLNITPDNPLITEPYIQSTDELNSKWKDILSSERRPIIGINWQGNPEAETAGLKGRSLPLEKFEPIIAQTNATLLSLQKGIGMEQLNNCSFKQRFVNCQDQINETWDFLETAAIINNCDLIITSDTAVAHLAGGMGKPTWLLLQKVPDWRWGLGNDTTFWYGSLRLFRQHENSNWDGVMQRVTHALLEKFEKRSASEGLERVDDSRHKIRSIQNIYAPISLGELVDKITILQIKTQHLEGSALENVKTELNSLLRTLNTLNINIEPTIVQRLKKVNQDLWNVEDAIREQERKKSFDSTFIKLARSVYKKNDQRSALKKEINIAYGSNYIEEKSYRPY